jgi:hypothetical protein
MKILVGTYSHLKNLKIYYRGGNMMRQLTILYHKYTAMASTLGLVAVMMVSASTFVSGAYAQSNGGAGGHGGWLYGHSSQLGQTNVKVLGQELTQGIKAQVGKVLGVQEPQSLLGMKAFVVLEGEHQTGRHP